MEEQFEDACLSNNLELVKTLEIITPYELDEIFIKVCKLGYLDMAKWLHKNGANITARGNMAFIDTCWKGQFDVAQWIYSELVKIFNTTDEGFIKILGYAFFHTCLGGNLIILQWLYSLDVDLSEHMDLIFIEACLNGYFDIAQWIHNSGATYDKTLALIQTCARGHLDMSDWLYNLGADISHPDVYIYACLNGQLHILQWLYSLGVNISGHEAFNNACYSKNIETVKWLIENPYKSSSFIQLDSYANFKLEIKNLLIDHNLVHPRQLEGDDLTYYLARTENLVPSDFDYPGTTKRGKHTKSALRNV